MSLLAELVRRNILKVAPIFNVVLSAIPLVTGRYRPAYTSLINTAHKLTQGVREHGKSLS